MNTSKNVYMYLIIIIFTCVGTLVNLTKHLSSHHGHFIDDEIINPFQRLLNGMQTFTLEIFKITLDGQTQENEGCSH